MLNKFEKKCFNDVMLLQNENANDIDEKCPRCGKNKMSKNLFENSISRYIDISICSDCGVEEAFEEHFRPELWECIKSKLKGDK